MPEGVLYNEWERRRCGRIFGMGFNLQNCKKEIRKAAINWAHDYDIENCHIVLLKHLVGTQLKLPALDEYVANKKSIREQIALDVGCAEEDVKRGIIAMLYGMNPLSGRKQDSVTVIFKEQAKAFGSHEFIRAMYKDLKQAQKLVVEAAPRSKSGLHVINAVGESRSVTHKDSELAAHVLQGLEASLLDIVIANYKVVLPSHDGWMLSEYVEPKQIEDKIKETHKQSPQVHLSYTRNHGTF
jgi:hypothetical protein